MSVKFKMCPRCYKTKQDPLERNWITPDQEFCTSCELEMYKLFTTDLGYKPSDIHEHFSKVSSETNC